MYCLRIGFVVVFGMVMEDKINTAGNLRRDYMHTSI